ncbi:MAG: bacillithiol system redox-active protein YtxJ [Minisyncoccia bacterium]
MKPFLEISHLSDIIEHSSKQNVIIFKYSNSCGSSERLRQELKSLLEKNELPPVYLITVQIQKALSKQIEEYFDLKHESPQILVIKSGKLVESGDHGRINTGDLLKFKV